MTIDDLIKKLDDYCKKFPDYVDEYKFPKSLLEIDGSVKNMSTVFASEFHEFNKWIIHNHKNKESSLKNAMENEVLTEKKIKEFKKYNDSITEFNEFLRAISLVFRDDVFINVMQYKLDYLDVPDKPILEELDIDLDNLLYDPDED